MRAVESGQGRLAAAPPPLPPAALPPVPPPPAPPLGPTPARTAAAATDRVRDRRQQQGTRQTTAHADIVGRNATALKPSGGQGTMPAQSGQLNGVAMLHEFWFMQFWQAFARSSTIWLLFARFWQRELHASTL